MTEDPEKFIYHIQMTSGASCKFPLSTSVLKKQEDGSISIEDKDKSRWSDGPRKGYIPAGKWDYWIIMWVKG